MAAFADIAPGRVAVLVVAVAFLAGAFGYFMAERADEGPGPDSVEVTFLQDMIAHHEQALSMSNAELVNGSEPGVQTFAREILLHQAYEIGLMERRLAEWGYAREARPEHAEMPGMATADELEQLQDATGPEADALFIALMQDHHAGGVQMAEVAAADADDEFVQDLAARMARNQLIEIEELDQVREQLGLSETPEGHDPDDIETDADHTHS